MKRKFLARFLTTLVSCLCVAIFTVSSIQAGRTAEVPVHEGAPASPSDIPASGIPASDIPSTPAPNRLPAVLPLLPGLRPLPAQTSDLPLGCSLQPVPNPPPAQSSPTAIQLPLSRFRQSGGAVAASANTLANTPATIPTNTQSGNSPARRSLIAPTLPSYTPREEIALADLTNFGNRYLRDANGRSAVHDPIVVLHETVGSAQSAINFFQTPHPQDEDQVSYHTLIREDGTIVYLVPPDKRAYGAGDSVFKGSNGLEEAVQTNRNFPPSVNNFAYHVSLETPVDGENNYTSHSGYTSAQYQSLAWLVAKTGIPDERLTMHKLVDRSGQRMDPRSFDTPAFLNLLKTYPRTQEISIGCLPAAPVIRPNPLNR